MKDGESVAQLHEFIKRRNIDSEMKDAFFDSVKESPYKPNVIFDITCKSLEDVDIVKSLAVGAGYSVKDIHIVWVLTHVEQAKVNNLKRSRSVPEMILVNTHDGVRTNMSFIMKNSEKLQNMIDGDIWVVFNVPGKDSRVDFHLSRGQSGNKKNMVAHVDQNVSPMPGLNGKMTRGYSAIHLKERGKPSVKFEELAPEIQSKILDYTGSDNF